MIKIFSNCVNTPLCLAFTLMIASCYSTTDYKEVSSTPIKYTVSPMNSSRTLDVQYTATAIPTTAALEPLPTIWIYPYLPLGFFQALQLPEELGLDKDDEKASFFINIGNEDVISTWIYALVAPFPTIPDNVQFDELHKFWLYGQQKDFPATKLLVDKSTFESFSNLWGNPSSGMVKIIPSRQIIKASWEQNNSWAIVPFEALDPRMKVIKVDGISPIQKDFDSATYPLIIPISLVSNNPKLHAVLSAYGPGTPRQIAPSSNLEQDRLTTIILTGVTALVRGTANEMEKHGMTYPGIDIRHWLRDADILHINNEVPFSQTCPLPFPRESDLIFCSRPEYIELLEDIGTDIVELSGDHFKDWGPEAMFFTIDLYKQRGWKYYGGGLNLEDGRRPLLIEHNGNHFAFIGCNAKGLGYAGARETLPGAVMCDPDWLHREIKRLKNEGYIPIVTFQHKEYYSYKASDPEMQTDFRTAVESGAAIVSGSQAHQPQSMEFYKDAFIHYGLGNLFFDQYNEGYPQRQAFIDRYIFYNEQHISTELLTIMFVDFARPRPMTSEERQQLLETIFQASDW